MNGVPGGPLGIKQVRLVQSILEFGNVKFADYTTDGITPEQLFAMRGSDGVSWGEVLDAQRLGVNVGKDWSRAKYEVDFPVFLIRPDNDQIVGNGSQDLIHQA